jgi:hypothetical protein
MRGSLKVELGGFQRLLSGPAFVSVHRTAEAAHAPDSATCERHLHVILTSHLPGRADAGVGSESPEPQSPRAALGPNPGLGAAGNDTMPPCVGWDAVPSTSFLPSASLLSRAVDI